MLLIKVCGNCRPCTFMEYMFCWGRKKLVDKMHELIHVHVTRTFKRFTTQLIHLFIDVAQCSMYIRSTKTLHHVHPYSLWDYSVESWKGGNAPWSGPGQNIATARNVFPTEARQKAFLVQGLQSDLKKLFRWIKSFDRHRYHNAIRSCWIDIPWTDRLWCHQFPLLNHKITLLWRRYVMTTDKIEP